MRRIFLILLLTWALLCLATAQADAQWFGWYQSWGRPYSWYSYPSYYVDPLPARLIAAGYYRRSVADSYKVFMEAELVKEDVRQKRIETYLKTLDARRIGIREEPQQEVNWVENQIEKQALLVALNPTDTEIKTGKALRYLRHFLENHSEKLQKSASEEIPSECLRNVSFKVGKYEEGGSLSVLIKGKIAWFTVLQDRIFEKERMEFDDLLEKIVNQAKTSASVNQDIHEQLLGLADKMRSKLEENFVRVNNPVMAEFWAPKDYFQAERFLTRDLRRALWALKSLSPEEFVAATQVPDARNVVELLDYMRLKGMEFDGAQDKQVMSYYTLHRAFANEIKKIRTFRPNASMN